MPPSSWQRRLWTIVKWVLTAVVLIALVDVGRRVFAELAQHDIAWEPSWIVYSGLLYLAGVGFSVWFWWWVMRSLGQRPGLLSAIRAYYIGHLGKYVPGKALVIVMRTGLIRGPEVRTSVAAMAVVYETFTCMAAGALLAALLITFRVQSQEGKLWQALLLLILAGVPTLPWIFNPVVQRLVAPFRGAEAEPLPRFDPTALFAGVGLNLCSWLFLGASLWAILPALNADRLGLEAYLDCTAYVCIASVAGFFTPAPGGLGAREWVLMKLLAGDLGGEGPAALAALLLRLSWVVSEVAIAVLLYPLPWIKSKWRATAE